jgi:uncharacterized protein YndB with AHSA1/START domain
MGTAATRRTIEKELFIRASPERVFRALTEPAELARWFGQGAEIDLRPGGALTFIFSQSRETGEVLAVEPPHRFAFTWGAPHATEATFLLEPRDGGTLLRLTETGFGQGDDWDRIFSDNSGGWDEELAHLRDWVERGNEPA